MKSAASTARRSRDGDGHGPTVFGVGDGLPPPKCLVQSFGDAGGGGEIHVVKLQANGLDRSGRAAVALDDGAFRNASGGGVIDGLTCSGAAAGHEAARDDGALRDGVHLARRRLSDW